MVMRTVSFYVFEGNSPDTVRFTLDSDEAPTTEAKFYYTDYKNCVILDIPYKGGRHNRENIRDVQSHLTFSRPPFAKKHEVRLLSGCPHLHVAAVALPRQETDDVPDSFKVFESFPDAVAVSDQNNIGMYECLRARRLLIRSEKKEAQYTWLFGWNGGTPRRSVSFYVFEGSSPDTFLYTLDPDETPSAEAKVYYADYDNCAVLDIPYNGRRCILWTRETAKDAVPSECVHEFMKYCGSGAPLYKDDLCSGDKEPEW
ncbi:uncharacterized protein [Dermacentor albipictus]|uniref:uncharacterized protein n=1 Tax=Dermacentor albipictus TaxID=60249 RepID=UPI0038FC08E2